MVGILNRVAHLITTTGAGTVTLGTVINSKLLSAAEAGAVNGQSYYWVLEDGGDMELFTGTYASSGPTVSRDTVLVSKIAGTAGTSKLTLSGNAALRSVSPAEAFAFALSFGAVTDLASASTVNIGAAATSQVRITGTTTITAFDSVAAGTPRWVRFNAALTLTHNATTLILPTGASITTVAGDTALFVSEGSGNWRCHHYQRADGSPLALTATQKPFGKQHIPLPCAGAKPRTTNGSTPYSSELATNDIMLTGQEFSASVDQACQWLFSMPKSSDESAGLTFRLHHTTIAGSSGSSVWAVRMRAVSDDDAMDGSWGTAVTVTDAFLAAGDEHITAESATITPGNSWAEGDLMFVELYRDADAGGDTLNGTAIGMCLDLFVTTNAGNDA